ncbi:MAG TPA: copper transporter [Dermatophilaceae bacterium]|nr:copper transporter [Dermatophilaceae bacterium]
MIDFRYHLVSIVSIFLALAVGIVLGAGPLKGDLGTRLTQETTALRADKAELRTELDAEKRGTAARDSFSSSVAPVIMKGQLKGKTVALVIAPGADSDLVKNITVSLAAAGAKVGSTITLTDAWADPAKRTFRNTLADQLATLVEAPLVADNPDELVATVLARAILGGKDLSTERVAPAASAALDGLKAGDLVKMSPDQIVLSSSAIIVGGPVKGSSQPDIDARLASYVQMVRSLKAAGSGVVVVTLTNATNLKESADLVTAVRKDSDAVKVVSTVDDADLPMGQTTVVLALAEQYSGGKGQYGLAADAKAITPDLTAKQ